jgi:pimeloyl-ACP methyl ester carboxylesterase
VVEQSEELLDSATRWISGAQFAAVNGVQLHYREAGRGPLVILLHGFPQFWYSWRRLMPALAEAGYRAIAPDLRGYNLSGKPKGVEPYAIDTVADDIAALIHHAGERRAHIIGHDWGGAIAWHLAMRHRDVVDHLTILNAPHPRAYARALRTPAQLWRSRYLLFFQIPGLPEAWIAQNGFAPIRRILRTEPARPGAFTEDDIDRYVAALARPWALTSAINYYRAAARFKPLRTPDYSSRIEAPTLLVWGDRDKYLGRGLTEGLERWVPTLTVAHLPDTSHWVLEDAPEDVERLVMDFLP